MTSLSTAPDEDTTLKEANDIIWDNKLNALPLIDEEPAPAVYGVPQGLLIPTKKTVNELLDKTQELYRGCGHQYPRLCSSACPRLVEAGADVLCIDSSEGFSEWQKRTIELDPRQIWRQRKGGRGQCGGPRRLPLFGRGRRGLCEGRYWRRFHLHHPRDTRASAAARQRLSSRCAVARDEYFEETGVYVPICSDGGIVHDYHITLALAMGADFVMLGRYFCAL